MSLLLRGGILAGAGILAGLAANAWSPRPAPLGRSVVAVAEQPGAACAEPHGSVARISVEEAKPLCVACSAVFVDTRTAQEFAAGHVTGAVHLSPGEPMQPVLAKLRAKDTVIVYDRDRECSAADGVAAQLQAQGFRDVRVLTGAWPEWLARGGPGESGSCDLCTVGKR